MAPAISSRSSPPMPSPTKTSRIRFPPLTHIDVYSCLAAIHQTQLGLACLLLPFWPKTHGLGFLARLLLMLRSGLLTRTVTYRQAEIIQISTSARYPKKNTSTCRFPKPMFLKIMPWIQVQCPGNEPFF